MCIFSSMPKVVREGRQVVNNIQNSSSLFLMKTTLTIFTTILMIILGDSVEGTTALLLMFLVSIPFFALYFWLFTRRDKKTEDSYVPTHENATGRTTVHNYVSRPSQISYTNENPTKYGNYKNSDGEIVIEKLTPQISFCRKCGNKLMPDSAFCNMCGTKVFKKDEER